MVDIATPKNETIECPFCKKSKIDVTTIPEYYSYHTARAFGKVKRIPVMHPEKTEVHNSCPDCKASKKEIKEVLEKGTTQELSHEERLKRLKEAGLPARIESKDR